ncbi:MAG: GH116 family glycosyl-hydrolase [Chitinophagaceae bacterium]
MNKKNKERRNFIKQSAILTAGFLSSRLPLSASNFIQKTSSPFNKEIDEIWIKSLYERGGITTYLKSRNELQFIGMPVGGINTGTLYLGGDGRLWLWDIFNTNQEGINPLDVSWDSEVHDGKKVRSRDGSAYVAPPTANEIRPLEQGFAIKINHQGKTIVRELCEKDWQEVSFEATYPVGKIKYTDASLPIEITMLACSPFIPLDENNSGLPATIFNIQIKNTSADKISVDIAGWLENKTAPYSGLPGSQMRTNTKYETSNAVGVFSTITNIALPKTKIETAFDYGTLCLTSLQKNAISGTSIKSVNSTDVFAINKSESTTKSASQKLIGNIVNSLNISAGETITVEYIISWHTPNLVIENGKKLPTEDSGRFYANQFQNAKEVADYVAINFKELFSKTLLWQNNWYDSTLPYWFLDRTFLNISSMATTTSHRFKSGRSWAWEGVGSCAGNCTHVWQYAQAVGRIFPAIEKDNRQRVDLGIALREDGGILFRGEFSKKPAIDGQAGTILRVYREHKMSADNSFLVKNWTKIKKAIQFIINQDKNKDGMTDTPMENTLDAVWDGEIAWIVGLCIAGVQAGYLMAIEMNDTEFANVCKTYVEAGKKNMEQQLFNGEYFIHKPDAEKGRKKLGSYNTCHIDQVYGQSWAFQLGMDRVIEKEKTVSALRSLWKYNFKDDVGSYIQKYKGGRPYALAGEGGMIMNTNPKNEPKPYGDDVTWQLGYFHECMSGFEHQVASHLIAEGMVDEGLILTKKIHERYHASKRNPFNEIECSDHYARAMASYGTFINACGFDYHGPKGYISFAPKWNKENFKAPFTAAEGWGSYSQVFNNNKQEHAFSIKYGSLKLNTVSLEKITNKKIKQVTAMLGPKKIESAFLQKENSIQITLNSTIKINENESLTIYVK